MRCDRRISEQQVDNIFGHLCHPVAGVSEEAKCVMLLRRKSGKWEVARQAGRACSPEKYLGEAERAVSDAHAQASACSIVPSVITGKNSVGLAHGFSCGDDEYLCVVELTSQANKQAGDEWSRFAALAIEVELLRSASNTDHLSAIGNRRALQEWLEKCRRPVVYFFDLDEFKQYNDVSHSLGDCVIAKVAGLLDSFATGPQRLGDDRQVEDAVAYRWGGDEFVVACEMATADAHEQVVADAANHAYAILRDLGRKRELQADRSGAWRESKRKEKAGADIATTHILPRGYATSVGVYVFHKDDDAKIKDDAEFPVRCASTAARAAKAFGKGQFVFWHDIQAVVDSEEFEIRDRLDLDVAISKGAKHSIRRDMLFDVLWTFEGETKLKGTIRAIDVRETVSFCRIERERTPIAKGDKVRLH